MYSNKLGVLEDVDRFLDTYKSQKFNPEDTKTLNNSIINNKIEEVT